ncbi:type II toxin-antitoxin system ParD family antitoxin [Rubrivirga sp. S365]|uniref:Type II toxin-antitoxin system ParD family antitoxin n=1 Tax=Rubrivirga litoralis TaxID=3075598 RepID=A0ABU3BML6_9BACT|nr:MULTISPECIES: type II toxin-antitoxin system ParD family antitoxin [unclassified Rubrivirga]MDT0630539.1 type II toxin-antitoxin system ParD family antitoxin [Rubrivirga sp. F394]MDT7856846.1 type II toxin-antitoxin system ParD family antitoxin [Rubrivirga sp. S365]
MNVSLPSQLDAYVRDLVRGGDYSSASEVVREGLRLLKEKRERDEETAELRRLVREGLASPAVRVTRGEMKALMRDRMAQLRGEVERGDRPAPGGSAGAEA